MSKYVAVDTREPVDGGYKITTTVHAAGDPGGGFDTLCGIEVTEEFDFCDTRAGKLKRGAKINCSQCKSLINACKEFGDSDFKI